MRYLWLILILFSCKIDRKSVIDRDRLTYRFTDDDYLFFKNLRQIYYDHTSLADGRLEVYRHGDRPSDASVPFVYPCIVVNPSLGEAYILIEHSEALADEEVIAIIETSPSSSRPVEYSLAERGRDNMLEFATKIYEGIMADVTIEIRRGKAFYPLFRNDEEKEAFRRTLADYYRLTNVF